jgi:hypothetical protein
MSLLIYLALQSGANAQQGFAIDSPKTNDVTGKRVIAVTGVGAPANSVVEITVTTTEPYLQTCKFTRYQDGKWKCEGVHLAGQGRHNDHEIAADLKINDQPVATSVVKNVKR